MYPQAKQPGHDLAVTSMIMGILSFLILPLVCSILAIVFGNMAKNRGNRSGMATAGIICGWISLGFILLAILIGIVIGIAFA